MRNTRLLKRSLGCSLLAGLVLGGALAGWRLWLHTNYRANIYRAPDEVPPRPVAIVFGAALGPDGRPSVALADRVESAAALYHAGKVRKLLMSGDNRFPDYNEPAAMRAYAQHLNVPAADILLDPGGQRTYDSCYRARAIFSIDEAVLITQAFHQARAIYLCNQLGVRSVGLVANNRRYSIGTRLWWQVRETLAAAAAWFDVHLLRPTPRMGVTPPAAG